MVKIAVDSVSDIPQVVAKSLGITIVPLYVRFGTKVYRDQVDLSAEEFYGKLRSNHIFPTTSAPSPKDFAQVYHDLSEETEEILTITVSAKLSATYEAAMRGKEQIKRSCRIEVIDSRTAVMGTGLIAIAAANRARTGANLPDLMNMVHRAIPKTHVRACFDTLEYLERDGRIGKAQALLGSALKISPIIGLKDGEVHPFDRKRSRARAIEWLFNFAASFAHIKGLAVEYATTPDEAVSLAQRVKAACSPEYFYASTVSPVVGAHTGPRVIAVSILEK